MIVKFWHIGYMYFHKLRGKQLMYLMYEKEVGEL